MAAFTTIDDPSAYFKVQIYTGNGSDNHAITFDDTDTDMQPDMVWIKNRDATDTHLIFDSVRGATKYVTPSEHPNPTEVTDTDTLDSFTSDGFQVDDDVKVNTNTEKYVAWGWKESATAGLDIVEWSGNSTNRTISHSLSAVPHFMFVIAKGDDNRTITYHKNNTSAPETDYLMMAYANATSDSADYWNDTAPTSSVFTVGTANEVNDTGNTYVGYFFTSIQGYSSFGSYTGNGNDDGPFCYCGFRPKYIMLKNTGISKSWYIVDNKRNLYNGFTSLFLVADKEDIEYAGAHLDIDFLSNGFKLRNDDNAENASGNNYIYMAFAEAPLVNSNGVPCNAK